MKRGLFFLRSKWFVIFKGFLIFVIGVGLSGCEGGAAPGSPLSAPCTPQAPNVNIYRQPPATWANGFFQNVPTLAPTSTVGDQQLVLLQEQQTSYASYASYRYLIDETKNWSSIQTIKLDNTSQAQVVVTFVSPQLVQAVYFREILSKQSTFSNFEMNSQAALDRIAMRDELIFFVAVTTTTNLNPNTASHTISIPIDQMVIMNSENLRVAPKHADRILAQPINSSMEPVFGYLAYPLAVINGVGCSWILDPAYNKRIMLTVPSIAVDGVPGESYNWVIPYSSLIDSGLPQIIPTYAVPSGFNESQIFHQSMPPAPKANLSIPNGISDDFYWENYAMFLWKQIVNGNN